MYASFASREAWCVTAPIGKQAVDAWDTHQVVKNAVDDVVGPVPQSLNATASAE
jgi:hypothetical protein